MDPARKTRNSAVEIFPGLRPTKHQSIHCRQRAAGIGYHRTAIDADGKVIGIDPHCNASPDASRHGAPVDVGLLYAAVMHHQSRIGATGEHTGPFVSSVVVEAHNATGANSRAAELNVEAADIIGDGTAD